MVMLCNAITLQITFLPVMADRVRFASFTADLKASAVLLSPACTYQGFISNVRADLKAKSTFQLPNHATCPHCERTQYLKFIMAWKGGIHAHGH